MSNDLTAWLGEYADGLDADARDRLEQAAETIGARYADPDLAAEQTAALSAAAQVAFGDTTMSDVVTAWRAAMVAERQAMTALTGAIAYAATIESENAIATEHGLHRGTVRKAVGK